MSENRKRKSRADADSASDDENEVSSTTNDHIPTQLVSGAHGNVVGEETIQQLDSKDEQPCCSKSVAPISVTCEGGTISSSTEDFPCRVCNETFCFKYDRDKHVATSHETESGQLDARTRENEALIEPERSVDGVKKSDKKSPIVVVILVDKNKKPSNDEDKPPEDAGGNETPSYDGDDDDVAIWTKKLMFDLCNIDPMLVYNGNLDGSNTDDSLTDSDESSFSSNDIPPEDENLLVANDQERFDSDIESDDSDSDDDSQKITVIISNTLPLNPNGASGSAQNPNDQPTPTTNTENTDSENQEKEENEDNPDVIFMDSEDSRDDVFGEEHDNSMGNTGVGDAEVGLMG